MREALPDARASAPAAVADPCRDTDGFRMWTWGEKRRRVPEGWRLPSTDVLSTWRMWHFGIPAACTCPLRKLDEIDLNGDDGQITHLSKIRNVMGEITEQLISMGVVESGLGIRRLAEEEGTKACTDAYVALVKRMKPGEVQKGRRWVEMRIPTVYHHMLIMRSREKRSREQAGETQSTESARGALARRQRLW
jgi:hypothetical protein